MEPLLTVDNLRVSYRSGPKEIQAVRGLSFQIGRGDQVALVGESGCGKSAVARSLMGLVVPPQGEVKEGSRVFCCGRSVIGQDQEQWQCFRGKVCSMVFQDALAALNPTLTVGRQIAEKLRFHDGLTASQAKAETLRLLDMMRISGAEKRFYQYPHQLSGGMRQRIMIAMALACGPSLMIADEPTTALDVTVQAEIMDLIKDLQSQMDMAVLLITHDLGIVAHFAEKILVMYAGKIVERGLSRDIFYRARHPYTRALLRAVPRIDSPAGEPLRAIEGAPPDMSAPPKGCAFWLRCPNAMKVCAEREPPLYGFEEGHSAQCWLYYPGILTN